MRWDDFDEFDDVFSKYLPRMGEGETVATQIATAACKLVYKWFNDGDVYDNTYYLEGWWNDLSSYANWLHKYVPVTKPILERIESVHTDDEYEELLYELCENLVGIIDRYATAPKVGSVYEEVGIFKYREPEYEDDDY